MRTIGVVTISRSDYGIYLPILRAISAEPALRLAIFAGGTHLLDDFAHTVDLIRADGFDVSEEVDYLLSSDTPAGVVKSMGLGVLGFGDAFRRSKPDILLVLGDRLDMFAAAAAALPQGIPLAHVHGGELTEGAIDDCCRHAMTKMSHLHFVSTAEYRERVLQLGEEPWRVHVVGAPSLDNLRAVPLLDRDELGARIGIPLATAPLIVTFHPETLEPGAAQTQITELLAALDVFHGPIVFTHPNADPESLVIRRALDEYASTRPLAASVMNLGTRAYFSLMKIAAAMAGNSSSGIIEAASFGLSVVNVGDRQRGRIRGGNVIDVPCERRAIASAIEKAVSTAHRLSCEGVANPYGDGHAAARIVSVLRDIELEGLLRKRFVDLAKS